MRTVLKPGWIIDGTGAPASEQQIIIVADGLIEAVLPVNEYHAQPGDEIRDLPDATLLPGLINNHVHLVLPGDNTPFTPWIDLQSDATLALLALHNAATSLRAGVTTVRDCGGRREVVLDVRNAQAAGKGQGARIISCGWTLTITGGHTRHFGGEVDGADGLARAVRLAVSKGVDYIKVMAAGGGTPGSLAQYPSFTVDELRAIVDTAHGLGRLVSAHCIATASIENAVDAGVDLIEHASFFAPSGANVFDERVAEKLAKSGIPVTPTLQVNRDLVDLLPEGDERSLWQRRQESQREFVGRLHALGVPMLAGSDAGWRATAFDTFWKELDELVASGLSPVAAIHAATGAVTNALRLGETFGTVRAGQQADLIAVPGNLAEDISRLANVELVMQRGEVVA